MHPKNRAERRHTREVWRNYRRFISIALWHHNVEDAIDSSWWSKGGKQYFACGNRCTHAMIERYSDHMEVKRLRCEPIELYEDEMVEKRS